MTSVLDKMNLRPQERRLVVIVAVVVFVVLNIWLVFPNFGALAKTKREIKETENRIVTYEAEIKNTTEYKKQIDELSTMGGLVATEEQALRLATEITTQATLSNVNVPTTGPILTQNTGGRTNAFYEEKSQSITVNTGEKELIDFLFNLGARETLIRVKNMNLGTDPTRMKLVGNLTLVKSFQRKAPVKTAAKPAASPAAKPAVPAPVKSTNPPAAKPPVKEPAKTNKVTKIPEVPKTTSVPTRSVPK